MSPKPKQLAAESAEAGLRLLQYYRSLYSSRFSTRSQLVYLVQICDAVIRLSGENGPYAIPSVVRFCFESLHEAFVGFAVAATLQESFRKSLILLNIALPEGLTGLLIHGIRSNEAMVGATFQQPVQLILQRLEGSLVGDWTEPWRSIMNSRLFREREDINKSIRRLSDQHSGRYLHIEALLNDP